jgi:hypothetical protein
MLTDFCSDVLTIRMAPGCRSQPVLGRISCARCDNLMRWFLRSLDDTYCLLRLPSPKANIASALSTEPSGILLIK